MKRFKGILNADLLFGIRSGVYLGYVALLVAFVATALLVPAHVRLTVTSLLLLLIPLLGVLLSTGWLVLSERAQSIHAILAVTPLRPWEYVLSKCLSMSAIAFSVGVFTALYAGQLLHPVSFLFALALTCVGLSAIAIALVCVCRTAARFLLWCIPIVLTLLLPPMLWLHGIQPLWMTAHPGVMFARLMQGLTPNLISISYLAVFALLSTAAFLLAVNSARHMFAKVVSGAPATGKLYHKTAVK